jgi:hypothetical protein
MKYNAEIEEQINTCSNRFEEIADEFGTMGVGMIIMNLSEETKDTLVRYLVMEY